MSTGRIALITDDPGWHGKQLRLAFAARGYQCDYVSITDCRLQPATTGLPIIIPGFEHALPDAVFVRGIPGGSLAEVVFYLDILHALKILGVPVYNNGRVIEASVDKALCSFLLAQCQVSTPLTWVTPDRTQALHIAEQELAQGHWLVSKPLFGSQGEGIRRLQKMTDLFWLTSSEGIFYLQRYVHGMNNEHADYRVFVIHNKVIAAMCRHGKSWLNNVARGAQCNAVVANEKMAELATTACRALDMDYAGVDIIENAEDQLQVIEVNSIPAWKGLQSCCNIKIAELLVDDLLHRYVVSTEQVKSAV